MVIILDFGSKINNFLLNHLSQQMVFIQPALDCCCWGYWIPARWVFQRLSRQERLRLGESSGRSLRVDWAMCAMHSWCKQAVWSTCLCPFTHDIWVTIHLFVCLFVLHFLFVLAFCWKKRLGPSVSVVLPGGRNCTIAQSARRRICPVTRGAFKKRREKNPLLPFFHSHISLIQH